jgi:hypothetical protein
MNSILLFTDIIYVCSHTFTSSLHTSCCAINLGVYFQLCYGFSTREFHICVRLQKSNFREYGDRIALLC